MGIDTNVLVRYYISNNPEQHKMAKSFIDMNEIFVSNIVLVEAYWVFSKLYKVAKSDIDTIFSHLKRLSNIHFESETVFSRSFVKWKDKNCDFGDAMIATVHEENGCETITFDVNASKRLGMQLLDGA